MTWWIISNIKFYCWFSVVAHLGLLPYRLDWIILNTWPNKSFPWLYVIIVVIGYLHNHGCSNRYDFVVYCILIYCTIFNYLVMGSVIVRAYCMRGQSWPYLIILYRTIIYTNNLSHGISSASLAIIWPYSRFIFCFTDKSYKP